MLAKALIKDSHLFSTDILFVEVTCPSPEHQGFDEEKCWFVIQGRKKRKVITSSTGQIYF